MKLIRFGMYYGDLKLRNLLGLSRTTLPMDVNWQWNYWLRRICYQHVRPRLGGI